MQVVRKGQTLTITVELDKTGSPSSTGKSLVLFSSGGFQPLEDGMKVNLTIIRPNKR